MSKKKENAHPFAGLRDLKETLAKKEAEALQARSKGGSGSSKKVIPPERKPTAAEASMSFAELMGGTKTTPRNDPRVPERAPPEDAGAREREDAEVRARLRELALGGARFEVRDDGVHLEGHRLGSDPAQLRALRRGTIPIDSRLDLHGFTTDSARTALADFLKAERDRGERCVKVIHGKGGHSPGGFSVLRGELAAWLSQGAGAEHVAAFSSVHDEDDTSGGVLVLLRRANR
ncbi:MAG: Smr/MutS family protein [Polyangiaceae bacterium]